MEGGSLQLRKQSVQRLKGKEGMRLEPRLTGKLALCSQGSTVGK